MKSILFPKKKKQQKTHIQQEDGLANPCDRFRQQ